MKLTNLKVNHLKNPLGFSVKNPSFSFQVEESTDTYLKSARIRVSRMEDMTDLVYDSGERTDISSLSFIPEQEFEGGIRYYWDVCAEADTGIPASAVLPGLKAAAGKRNGARTGLLPLWIRKSSR